MSVLVFGFVSFRNRLCVRRVAKVIDGAATSSALLGDIVGLEDLFCGDVPTLALLLDHVDT